MLTLVCDPKSSQCRYLAVGVLMLSTGVIQDAKFKRRDALEDLAKVAAKMTSTA